VEREGRERMGIVLFPFGPTIVLPPNFGGGGRKGGERVFFKCLIIMGPTNHFPFLEFPSNIPNTQREKTFLFLPFPSPLHFWNFDLTYLVSFSVISMRKHINV